MLLIRPSVNLESLTPQALQHIERCGRTCYKSESKITQDSAEAFTRMIIERGHESVLEHASASIRFICDRGVSHEIVRHRIASFSQESTRYVNYTNSENIGFIIPSWLDLPEGVFKLDQLWKEKDTGAYTWLCAISDSEKAYRELIGAGWKPEQARSVLPNSLKTEIVMTGNFREWRHFFKLRDAAPAHPQMSQVAAKAHVLLRYAVPVVFE